MIKFEKERREVAQFMRRLYEQKLTTTSGGNVSRKVDNVILITASQTDKAKITAREVGILSIEGENLTPELKPSMESKMHLALYQKRPEIVAIVHAHPVFATSFAITGKEILTNLAGEARAVLGTPVFANYSLMGTQEFADIVATAGTTSNVILLENHGVITLGKSLLQAYDRMEVLEATAKLTLITTLLGGGRTLSDNEVKAIDQLFE
jgi:L-fuculose-phosphate aldolase